MEADKYRLTKLGNGDGNGKKRSGKASTGSKSHMDYNAQLFDSVQKEKPRIVKRLLDS